MVSHYRRIFQIKVFTFQTKIQSLVMNTINNVAHYLKKINSTRTIFLILQPIHQKSIIF